MPRIGHKELDSAIVNSLQIDSVDTKVSVSVHGKISIARKDHVQHYFLKTSSGTDAANTFEGTLPFNRPQMSQQARLTLLWSQANTLP